MDKEESSHPPPCVDSTVPQQSDSQHCRTAPTTDSAKQDDDAKNMIESFNTVGGQVQAGNNDTKQNNFFVFAPTFKIAPTVKTTVELPGQSSSAPYEESIPLLASAAGTTKPNDRPAAAYEATTPTSVDTRGPDSTQEDVNTRQQILDALRGAKARAANRQRPVIPHSSSDVGNNPNDEDP